MNIMEAAADGTGLSKVLSGAWGKWTSDGRYFISQTRHGERLDSPKMTYGIVLCTNCAEHLGFALLPMATAPRRESAKTSRS